MVEVDFRRRFGGDRPHERVPQVTCSDALQQIGHHIEKALLEADQSRQRAVGVDHEALERRGCVFERLALEQSRQQQIALLEQPQLFVEVDVVAPGQQTAGLELDERGGDQQELGRDLEVHLTHTLELGQVAVDDAGERHLVEIDLLLRDEVQQEVEGPLEDGCLHLVVRAGADLDPSPRSAPEPRLAQYRRSHGGRRIP